MKYTPRLYAQAYLNAASTTPVKDLPALTKNFWRLLWRHKKFSWHKRIIKEFIQLWNEQSGIKTVQIATSRPLDKATADRLTQAIAYSLKQAVEANFIIKPHLLGGTVVQIDDRRFDASVKGRLDSLYSTLAGQPKENKY